VLAERRGRPEERVGVLGGHGTHANWTGRAGVLSQCSGHYLYDNNPANGGTTILRRPRTGGYSTYSNWKSTLSRSRSRLVPELPRRSLAHR